MCKWGENRNDVWKKKDKHKAVSEIYLEFNNIWLTVFHFHEAGKKIKFKLAIPRISCKLLSSSKSFASNPDSQIEEVSGFSEIEFKTSCEFS